MLRRTGLGVVALLAACACKGHPQGPAAGPAGSGATAGSGAAAACDAGRAHVAQLYRAEAQANAAAARDATFVDDNVAMVMADCAKDPGRVAACAGAATSVAALEKDCLIPLDDEGTEGERIGP